MIRRAFTLFATHFPCMRDLGVLYPSVRVKALGVEVEGEGGSEGDGGSGVNVTTPNSNATESANGRKHTTLSFKYTLESMDASNGQVIPFSLHPTSLKEGKTEHKMLKICTLKKFLLDEIVDRARRWSPITAYYWRNRLDYLRRRSPMPYVSLKWSNRARLEP